MNDITAVVVEDRGVAPIEEYLSPEQWLMALPVRTVMRLTLDDGRQFRTTVDRLLDSPLLGEIVDLLRVQTVMSEFR